MARKKSHSNQPARSRLSVASRLLGDALRDTIHWARPAEPRSNKDRRCCTILL
jgi:hypothetical protein